MESMLYAGLFELIKGHGVVFINTRQVNATFFWKLSYQFSLPIICNVLFEINNQRGFQ